jgi:hypothetical protein
MENYFKGFTVEHIEWNKNTKADDLATAIARSTTMPPDVFFQVLEDASIKTVLSETRLINVIEGGGDWRASIMTYLRHYYEPDNTTRAYQIIDNNLYRASISGPLLR